MDVKPLKVCEVTQYIKRILVSDPLLYNLKVEGEISNFKYHYSGHMYFTLKDDKSKIKCIMFNHNSTKLKFLPEDGMNVIVSGCVSVYERDGNYQLYVNEIQTKGIGELYIAYEQLKNRLEVEGLFNQEYKKPIPYLPKKIGVVTSATGAAVKDLISVIKRRMPRISIIIYPVLVQGPKAHQEICEGIRYFDNRSDIDVIITGRGGGSIEELWAFNEEEVARAIFNAKTPIISAVGHETDYTIADFVADLRAPTPSAAGEMVVPTTEEIKTKLDEMLIKFKSSMDNYISNCKNRLTSNKTRMVLNNPVEKINQKKQIIDNLFNSMIKNNMRLNSCYKSKLERLGGKLHALSPLSVLNRGYSIVLNENGHVIKSIDDVQLDSILKLIMKDGELRVKAIDIIKDK